MIAPIKAKPRRPAPAKQDPKAAGVEHSSPRIASPATRTAKQEPEAVPVEQVLALDLQLVPLERLKPNPFQPRMEFDAAKLEELAESLKADGFLQTIVARRSGDEFEVLDGWRRRLAAGIAELPVVPVFIRAATDAEMAELAIVANDCREELNPVERAKAYQRILDMGSMNQQQLSRRLHRSHAFVALALQVLTFPEALQSRVSEGKMSTSVCAHLLNLRQTPDALEEVMGEIETVIAAAGKVKIREVKEIARTVEDRRAAYDRSATRLDPAAVNEAALAAWQQRWLEELLMREIEHRGPAGVLKAIGVSLADAWHRGAPHLYEFFDLHSKGELIDLADEWGATIDPSKARDAMIRRLMGDPKIREKLPAELAAR